jgi:Fic family protein
MKKISENMLKKYPYISFNIDLRGISFQTWMLLGQCVSKCDHIKKIPLMPSVSKELHKVYLIKGAVATTAIEGNTLSEEQFRNISDGKSKIEPSKEYLKQEIDNIIKACNLIGTNIKTKKYGAINKEVLCELNKIVLDNVPVEDEVIPGSYRNNQIGVGSYRAPAGADVQDLMAGFCDWLNNFNPDGLDRIMAAIIKAIAAHIYFVLIHPFGDGNGRTARLIEFMILLSSGAPSPVAHILSNHYNQTRTAYYRQLDKISKTGGNVQDFFAYAIQGFRDGLQEVIDAIIEQVQLVSWRDFVREQFQPSENESARRQRNILIQLSGQKEPLTLNEIEQLTAKIYLDKGKTKNSFTRDWNSLLKTDLVIKKDGKYVSNFSLILNQLPFSI